MARDKAVMEIIIWFVEGEPRVKTNQPMTEDFLALLLAYCLVA